MPERVFRNASPPDGQPIAESDVIGQILERLESGASADQLRREFGGDRVYIPSRPHLTDAHRRQIAAELQRSTAAQVAKRWGISERQAYRIRRQSRRDM
jgi:Mor family transcriptional regulator